MRVTGRDFTDYDITSPSTIDLIGRPKAGLPDEVNEWRWANRKHLNRGLEDLEYARKCRFPTFIGSLVMRKIDNNGNRLEFGLASVRVVTDEFVQEVVDELQASTGISDYKYHGIGTNDGATNESASDSALDSELTTEYATDSTRATDSQGEGSSANIYQTVGTNEVDASVGIEEHGVFNVQSVGGAGELLMDRSTFSVINLSSGEKIESTYELTLSSGG